MNKEKLWEIVQNEIAFTISHVYNLFCFLSIIVETNNIKLIKKEHVIVIPLTVHVVVAH